MSITFDYNNSTTKLLIRTEDKDLFSRIREHFSVEKQGAKFAKRFSRFAPTRQYMITPTGICELGLFWEIKNFLIEKQILVPVEITPKLKSILSDDKVIEFYNNFKFELRDYQKDVIKNALSLGRGTCVLGTGAGKTFVTAALIENYFQSANNKNTFKCLVIVPDLGLVTQTYDEFLNCGSTFKLTKWSGKCKPDLTANVIICNIGILQSQFDKNEWVKFVDLLIVDECHKIKLDNKISKMITKLKTYHKYGFTGTLPEEQIDKWSIIGKFGPVIYEKSSFELRNEDFLVNVAVKVLDITYSQRIPRISDNEYRDELAFLQENSFRNEIICKICNKLTNNTLILVNHIQHGEILHEIMSKLQDKRVFFIKGEVDVVERDKIKVIMENSDNIICIAISAIFSTGVNIKNLHNIVFAAGGKSFVRTVQSIGRGLRKHDTKSSLVIIDIADNLKYGNAHSIKRQSIYTTEKIKYTKKVILQP
jgi:superfamily II DNA or RNA helicase